MSRTSWDDRLDDLMDTAKVERLPVEAPPCSGCRWWRPHITVDERGDVGGVRFCVADTMHPDFSCFEERPS